MELRFRLLQSSDFHLLVDWINTPHVSAWWDRPATIDSIKAIYEPRVGKYAHTKVYIVEANDKPIGFIQFYRHIDYPDWDKIIGIDKAIGIDYLIGDPAFLQKGIGVQMIKKIIPMAFQQFPDMDLIVSTPQRDNIASCRALEKAGFEKIDERILKSDDPSDKGISSIYVFRHSIIQSQESR